jgi:hypothetical protein
MKQRELFAAVPALPAGMVYVPEFISPKDEARLLSEIAGRERFRLLQEDIEALRSSIYRGPAHDDSFFEERWEQRDLLPVLEKDWKQE